MTTTPSLFDLDAARQARDAAIAQAAANADTAWFDAALRSVSWLAMTQEHFTTDDVWAVLVDRDEATHEPRALGAVMQRARKLGYCVPTDRYQNSARPDCHSRPVRVWESSLVKPHRGDLTVVGSPE